MTSLLQIVDAEAATYAVEAAASMLNNLSAGNYVAATIDAVAMAGWVKNALI